MRLSEYFAQRTLSHSNKVGGSYFRRGTLEREGNCILVCGEYRLSFKDDGRFINVSVDSNESMSKFKENREEFRVHEDYSDVIEGVEIVDSGSLEIRLKMTHHANSSGRVQNKNKLFFALYKTAVEPLLKTAYKL